MKKAFQVIAAIAAAMALAAILTLVNPPPARGAEGKPVLFDCGELAVNVAAMADFRDTGARLELVVRLARTRFVHLSEPELAAFVREIRRLWRERLPQEEAAARLFRRCRAQMGDMGRES